MSNQAVTAVFPSLGATHSRPSRVTPGALSPFASIAVPVPAPKGVEACDSGPFPDVSNVDLKPKLAPKAATDPSVQAQIRAEAAAAGFERGFAEGLDRGVLEGRNQGYEQGRREAYEEEMAQRQAELDHFAQALQAKADALNEGLASWQNEREQAMADLAMDVVQRLLSHELETSRESVLAIAKEALAEVSHGTHARVRINPFDVAILDRHRAQILSASVSLRDVDFVEDPAILGGCLIETEGGVVDATLGTRLVLLEDAWREAA